MLKRVLGTSALCLMAAGSVPALAADVTAQQQEAFTAMIEGWGGGYFQSIGVGNFGPDDQSFFSAGIDARARLNISDSLSMQLDGSADRVFGGEDSNDTYEKGYIGGLHLSSYSDTGMWGIFGGLGKAYGDDESARVGVVGLEGQMYYDQSTVYLQAGYVDGSELGQNGDSMDAFHDAFFVRGVERYYLSEQTRIQAELSGAVGKQDSDNKTMIAVGWGLRADHQYTDSLSVFAGYKGGYYDNGSGSDTGSFSEHLVNVGVTLQLHQPSLMDADRHGASLDLPWVTHWVAAGNAID